MASGKEPPAVNRMATVKKVRGMIAGVYANAFKAKETGQPVAYVMLSRCGLEEIVRAMGIYMLSTENYSALCAATQDVDRFLARAEAEGYCSAICGYARVGLGFDAMRCELGMIPSDSADGGMVMPDMLIGSTVACDTRFKWYQALGHSLGDIPLFNLDFQQLPKDQDLWEVRPYYIRYYVEQFRALVDFLEKHTGRKMDWDRLDHIIDISMETLRLSKEAYEFRKAIPCPMSGRDHWSAAAPRLILLGTEEALNFYWELKNEMQYRVDHQIAAVPNEKYRLIWGRGLPPWHALWMFDYFARKGAAFVQEARLSIGDSYAVPRGMYHPLERLAIAYAWQWSPDSRWVTKGGGDPETERVAQIAYEYRADGIVVHITFSCRNAGVANIHWAHLLHEETGLPILVLESDIIDPHSMSRGSVESQIDAFLDTLDAHKASTIGHT